MSIVLKDITKKYVGSREPVIEHLDLTIDEGSFTVLLGPSGCGKTTLLRMIAGLEDVTEGQIFLGDEDITDVEPSERNIAMVFQNYAIYPHMTVRGNVVFGLKNYKISKEELNARTDYVLKLCGLSEYADRKPNQLSGGQRQRVALARAISKSPRAFLMDEPLSNLDAKLRNQMRSEMIQLYHHLGCTFVYVTHDQNEAMTMGTDIVVLRDGVIMQHGTPEEIYENPSCLFVAQFIGDPGMNILEYEDGGFVGFRPRDISLVPPSEDALELQGKVLTCEYMGYEVMLSIDIGIGIIMVRSRERRQMDETITLYVPGSKMFFFDKEQNRVASLSGGAIKRVFHVDEQ